MNKLTPHCSSIHPLLSSIDSSPENPGSFSSSQTSLIKFCGKTKPIFLLLTIKNKLTVGRARNSACPLARDKWIWRRTTNIASICCPPDNLGLAESRQPADCVTRQSRRTRYPRHQLRPAWTTMPKAKAVRSWNRKATRCLHISGVATFRLHRHHKFRWGPFDGQDARGV